ncbi:MAG: lipoate--protein ligase family protein [Thermodesulfovibrionia bacterium]
MALDEAISEAVRKGLSPPTMRFYQWDKPSISIGYFQRASDINIHYCREMGYPIVRRPTGGRAILHNDDLTYSLSARFDTDTFKGNLLKDYSIISNALSMGMRLCGIHTTINHSRRRNTERNPACFKFISYGEVTVEGKKITGNAQKRYADGFLQQGSITMTIDREGLRRVLNLPKEDFNEIAAIRDFAPETTIDGLINALKKAFEETLGVKLISDNPTRFEMRLAKELETKKYSTDGWNLSRHCPMKSSDQD